MNRTERVIARADELFAQHRDGIFRRTSHLFAVIMIAQWAFAILIALIWSPYGWAGKIRTTHVHVYAAILLGGAITALPVFLAITRPTSSLTRHVVAIGQMLWSGLLIHLSGGRIETHFHIFGSLAFLAFYRDWKILVTATIVVATDHLLRGIFWPESIYGVANPEWWRFIEHAFWVVYEDVVLILSCLRGIEEMHQIADRQAEAASLSESEREKSVALEKALGELQASHETLRRTEKLAAVGQLAASVGHELRNPLTAVRNAHTYITRKLSDPKIKAAANDPRVEQFSGIIERELDACTKIIGDLLDFARERPLNLRPCPLRPLVEEAIGLVHQPHAKVINDVPESVPIPNLDKEQFRQILVNLVQNAAEAAPVVDGHVTVKAEGGGEQPWRIIVSDNGAGIPADVLPKIFEPLFTTKTKGTGLGLAVVSGIVLKHSGTIRAESAPGQGASFIIELPPATASKAA